jgi:serine/threonine protein phosphatase PrpC
VVQKMVDAGFVAPAALRESAQRSRLFAALGHAECHVPTVGETAYPVAAGDAFLLCTDGFWAYIDEAAMERALAAAASAADWLRAMEQQVVAAAGPGQDNFSALAVWCSNPTPGAPAA